MNSSFQLGDCRIDVDRLTVVRGVGESGDESGDEVGETVEVTVEPKTMEVLVALAERAGTVLSGDELIDIVWEGRALGDNPVYGAIGKLRRALGDDARSPRYIETVSRRGYRLLVEPEPLSTVPDQATDPPPRGRSLSPRWILAAASLAFLLVLGIFWRLSSGGMTPATSAVEQASEKAIAVLPFTNVTGNSDFDVFGVGFSEEVLNTLARVERLRVMARNAAFGLGGEGFEIPELAESLDVGYVLTGTVHPDGERLLVSARLLDAAGQQLWAESYDRQTDRILEVRNEVAEAVARVLSLTLEQQADTGQQSREVAAVQSFVRGRELTWLGLLRHADEPIEAYQKAIEIEPGYADAHAGLARVYVHEGMRDEARRHAELALQLSPDAAEAHLALGLLAQRSRDRDRLETAERHLRRAIELNPSLSEAWHYLGGVLQSAGRWPEALRQRELGLLRDPRHYGMNRALARAHSDRGDLQRAMDLLDRLLESPHPAQPALEDVGRILWSWSRFAELIETLGSLGPDLPRVMQAQSLASIANGQQRLGLTEEAAASYQDARNDPSWPGDGLAVSLRLDYLGRADRPDLVLDELDSLRERGLDSLVRSHSGIANIRAGRFDRGIELLEERFQRRFFLSGSLSMLDAMQFLAFAHIVRGDGDRVEERLDQLLTRYRQRESEGFAEDPYAQSNIARIFALKGDAESAIRYLATAFDRGWVGYFELINDLRWQSVRDHPSYPSLLERARRIVDEQRSLLGAPGIDDSGGASL